MKRTHPALQPTLKDIAKATGLTEATVSRILSGKEQFAAETRKRVEQVADRLGYRPNRLVRGIQTGRTGMIGAILPIHVEWGARLLTGLQRALAVKDYVPLVLDCPSPVLNELDMIYHLIDRRVEGIVLFPRDDAITDDYFAEVHARKIPLVVLNRKPTYAHCHFVGFDDRGSGRLAAEHLLGIGHRVLGHLAGPPTMSTGRERAEGFSQTAMACAGVSVAQAVMPTFLPDEDLIEQFLDANPSITAIFCANEAIALGLYNVAGRRGARIPEQLSVVSHGDGRAASLITPKLTSTVENCEMVGEEAAKMVVQLASQRSSPRKLIEKRVATGLVVRESTTPFLGENAKP